MKNINVGPVPVQVSLNGLSFNPGDCADNSLKVAAANPGVRLVEGILQISGKDKTGKALSHMWNELNGAHFDVTAPLWNGKAEEQEIDQKNYVQLFLKEFSEIPVNVPLEFEADTKDAVSHANLKLADWPFKFEQVVVLLDPVSHKPVNMATILNYDETQSRYQVAIHRYNNEIVIDWKAALIKESIPALGKEVEQRLAAAELAADPLVGEYLKKHTASQQLLEVPLSMPQYIAYYFQMDIAGQMLWRLLTFEDYTGQTK